MKTLMVFIICVFTLLSFQAEKPSNISELENLLEQKDFQQAHQFLEKELSHLWEKKSYDSLILYPFYIGEIEIGLNSIDSAKNKIDFFIRRFAKENEDPNLYLRLIDNVSEFYAQQRWHDEIIALSLSVIESEELNNNTDRSLFAKINYNLSFAYLYNGEYDKSVTNFRKSYDLYRHNPNATHRDLYFANYAIGTSKYLSFELDSALYYFDISKTELLKDTLPNEKKFHSLTGLSNNISNVYQLQGNFDKAIENLTKSIEYNQTSIDTGSDFRRISKAKKIKLVLFENLAALYSNIGDNQTQLEILENIYDLKNTDTNTSKYDLASINIKIGNSYIHLLRYNEAERHFLKAIDLLDQIGGSKNLFFNAYANIALIEENKMEYEKARYYYDKAGDLLSESGGGNLPIHNLEYYWFVADFYTKIGLSDKALESIQLSRRYLDALDEEDKLLHITQEYNEADIKYKLKGYKNAYKQANQSLEEITNLIDEKHRLDSIQLELLKSNIELLSIRSKYELIKSKDDISQAKSLLVDTQELINKIEQQKVWIQKEANTNTFNANHKDVYEFAMELSQYLYEQTNEDKYVDLMVDFHEQSIFHKIRSRLLTLDNNAFKNVSQEVLDEERELKLILNEESSNYVDYAESIKNRIAFIEKLKVENPQYYNLKYGNNDLSISDIRQKIDKEVTLIRYFFIEDSLKAYVYNDGKTNIVDLESPDNKNILLLQDFNASEQGLLNASHNLYLKLWHPIERYIATKKVIVIPDKDLFNLNFEALTTKPSSRLKDITQNSLLSKYVISYNFSSYFVEPNNNSSLYTKPIVGFAPAFTSEMKKDFETHVNRDNNYDNTYLTLLPQPNTLNLVQKTTKKLHGVSYLKNKATKSNFLKDANNANIIHLGTHAESNNISPDFSRLVFAKSESQNLWNANYLYNYEIYGQELNSDLTILSACETGKPNDYPGEGMISLAHAFTYAGSKSIVTTLWKVDETSTNEVLDYFYENIEAGDTKDVALQQAKIEYLENNIESQLHPSYWAGLVLFGDTNSLPVGQSEKHWLLWLSLSMAFLLLGYYIYKYQENKKKRDDIL